MFAEVLLVLAMISEDFEVDGHALDCTDRITSVLAGLEVDGFTLDFTGRLGIAHEGLLGFGFNSPKHNCPK